MYLMTLLDKICVHHLSDELILNLKNLSEILSNEIFIHGFYPIHLEKFGYVTKPVSLNSMALSKGDSVIGT